MRSLGLVVLHQPGKKLFLACELLKFLHFLHSQTKLLFIGLLLLLELFTLLPQLHSKVFQLHLALSLFQTFRLPSALILLPQLPKLLLVLGPLLSLLLQFLPYFGDFSFVVLGLALAALMLLSDLVVFLLHVSLGQLGGLQFGLQCSCLALQVLEESIESQSFSEEFLSLLSDIGQLMLGEFQLFLAFDIGSAYLIDLILEYFQV